jgi:membrane-bound serine protease (ClpP class)
VLGIALLVIDLHATTHGVLTIGALICLAVGLPLLFSNAPAPYHVDTTLVVGIGLSIAAFWVFITSKGFAARRQPVKTGPQTLIGAEGEMHANGLVMLNGELWHAHAADGSRLAPGEQVAVQEMDGLELTVEPLTPQPEPLTSTSNQRKD